MSVINLESFVLHRKRWCVFLAIDIARHESIIGKFISPCQPLWKCRGSSNAAPAHNNTQRKKRTEKTFEWNGIPSRFRCNRFVLKFRCVDSALFWQMGGAFCFDKFATEKIRNLCALRSIRDGIYGTWIIPVLFLNWCKAAGEYELYDPVVGQTGIGQSFPRPMIACVKLSSWVREHTLWAAITTRRILAQKHG